MGTPSWRTAGTSTTWRSRRKIPARLPFPFADGFESGLGNWTISGYDWNLTTSTSRSLSHSLTDSPAGDYPSYAEMSATLVHPFDLAGATAPVLTFWHKGHVDADYTWSDYIRVESSTDGGTTWSLLRSLADLTQDTWSFEQIDLPRSNNVKIRFRLVSDGNTVVADGWYIDDVEIKEKDPARLSFPFVDGFEGGLGNWTVSGYRRNLTTSTSRSLSHSLTDSPAGDYPSYAEMSATLVHPFDLAGATAPVLTFWHRATWTLIIHGAIISAWRARRTVGRPGLF